MFAGKWQAVSHPFRQIPLKHCTLAVENISLSCQSGVRTILCFFAVTMDSIWMRTRGDVPDGVGMSGEAHVDGKSPLSAGDPTPSLRSLLELTPEEFATSSRADPSFADEHRFLDAFLAKSLTTACPRYPSIFSASSVSMLFKAS